jgi:hypothetical protein
LRNESNGAFGRRSVADEYNCGVIGDVQGRTALEDQVFVGAVGGLASHVD